MPVYHHWEWQKSMSKPHAETIPVGAKVFCERTGVPCEVLKHCSYDGIEHVLIAYDTRESCPRQVTLSLQIAKDRFSAERPIAERKNFFSRILRG